MVTHFFQNLIILLYYLKNNLIIEEISGAFDIWSAIKIFILQYKAFLTIVDTFLNLLIKLLLLRIFFNMKSN